MVLEIPEIVIKFGKPVLVFIIVIAVFTIIMSFIKRALLKKTSKKIMIHNITVFSNLITYLFIIIAVVGIFFYSSGNGMAFGIATGLFSAALGWALQRPITGIAAWIMVVVKKPFRIGDRILINNVKGDVTDITLTHIYLKEVGGTVASEELSGRIVMVPNSLMFDQNIINYTIQDEYILDDVGVLVTYESDLDKAIRICEESAKKIMKNQIGKMPKNPYVRVQFQGSGIDIKVRYYVKAGERIEVSSNITQEIFREFNKEKSVEIAYPHTEVVLRKKILKR